MIKHEQVDSTRSCLITVNIFNKKKNTKKRRTKTMRTEAEEWGDEIGYSAWLVPWRILFLSLLFLCFRYISCNSITDRQHFTENDEFYFTQCW